MADGAQRLRGGDVEGAGGLLTEREKGKRKCVVCVTSDRGVTRSDCLYEGRKTLTRSSEKQDSLGQIQSFSGSNRELCKSLVVPFCDSRMGRSWPTKGKGRRAHLPLSVYLPVHNLAPGLPVSRSGCGRDAVRSSDLSRHTLTFRTRTGSSLHGPRPRKSHAP